ncbi:hypothetical protein OIU74_024796 [Salix koriyanagi]|uniref:Aspartate/glutamate/uridylate kinase domain-containing protein n=1 Tax=Salix koriyanagi TaxID=2511006 RepID=A0A9Q1A8H9_9ROSI|nr:hypothetical protein OIU74_024796 [Salix koriyanagi]
MALSAASISNASRTLSSSTTFSPLNNSSKKISPSHFSSSLSLAHRSSLFRRSFVSQWGRRESLRGHVSSSVKAVLVDESKEKVKVLKGDMWSVHKFGGTCVGSSERIKNVADIILKDSSEGKLVVVSAMSKVTDMMYDLINKAQSRDDSYLSAVDAVFEKHRLTAMDLIDGDDLASFLSRLHHDINNLKAMLRAIYIAGHATESFSDFCCRTWGVVDCSDVVICC